MTTEKIWSRRLVVLMGCTFLAYANMSVFFQFYPYLQSLPIAPASYGLLIGAFSATSLLIRPIISPWITPRNGVKYMYLGTALVIISLVAYKGATGFWSLFLVRIIHGLSFVFLGAALIALIVACIPEGRSSQVFGLLSIVTMAPSTVTPPLWPFLDNMFNGFANVLMAFAFMTLILFPMAALSKPAGTDQDAGTERTSLGWADIKTNLADVHLLGLFTAMFFLYCGVALVFFFLAGMASQKGLVHVGVFFALTTICEIGVRLLAGGRLDRMPKAAVTAWTMTALALGYALLNVINGQAGFYVTALILGLSWGISMPLFSGLVFDWSPHRFRAFNTNLGMQIFQAGFFIGPIAGGFILEKFSFEGLYYFAAVLSLAGAMIMLVNGKPGRSPRTAGDSSQ